jgi:hypothetical protein
MFFMLTFIVHYLQHGRFKYIFVYILPEDGHRSGPKLVVSSAQ